VRRAAALTVLLGALGAVPARAADAPSGVCLGDVGANGVLMQPGSRLRFGLTPAGEAGALGPAVPAVPDDPPQTLSALARLRPPRAPFVLRLNRFFWADGEAGIRRFLALAKRYTDAGYPVELQVRYHPAAGQEGNVGGFVAFVREVVDRFGPNPRVIGLQVTNEVNFTISPDSSDGAYAGARDALIQGVIAAKDQARRRGFHQLTVGFNWFFRTDPNSEAGFWGYLRDHGGPAFVSAVDWVGLDTYPGTAFPPAETPGGERDGMVAAMSQLRQCFMPIAGLSAKVPIHVEENGWPTGPGRAEDQQARSLETMVRAVHDFRGTYHVTDYRWFDLRDHNTSSANFQHHYGLLRDDYSPKPAFDVYRGLVDALALREPDAGLGPPRLGLRLAYRRGRCAPVRATVTGPDRPLVRSMDVSVGSRRLARIRRPPLAFTVRRRGLSPRHRYRLRVRATLTDGRAATLARRLRACAP
jgi:hypothetical protein